MNISYLFRFLSCGLTFLLCGAFAGGIEIWVAPDGSDSNSGTREEPFGTILMAQRQARELRRLEDPGVADGIRIILRGGDYRLHEPLFVRWEDSGTEDSPTVFAAAEGETPVISGAVHVTGWRRTEAGELPGLPEHAAESVWVSETPRVAGRRLDIRNLWVGTRKAQRAWDTDGAQFERILDWDRDRQEAWIPADALRGIREPDGLEMVVHQMWAIAILRVKTIEVQGERALLRFHEPENRVQWEHPWPPVVISEEMGNSIFYLTNRAELLDAPGEWFQEPGTGRIYYWPREDEDLAEVAVHAPVLETLVRVEGTADRPVQHVHFEGLRFRHTAWMRPSHAGHVPLQAGFYMYEAYKLRPAGTPDKARLENQAWVGRKPAAVELRHVRGTRFSGCFFENLASAGLDYVIGSDGDVVEGNVFRDIAGNGFVVGAFQEEGVETHIPYDPEDERELCRNLRFSNNLVTDVANEDWGCVGVIAGYVQGLTIANNEISDVAYTGISLGWGWIHGPSALADNRILANHIHHYAKRVYDTGGIYTLSPQPGSLIAGNAIHSIYRPDYVHDPFHWSYIYLDEGSNLITIEDNWTEGIKFSTNVNGSGNVWRRNGPDVSADIRDAAGLEPGFRHLLEHAAVRARPE